jgi:hypothetical protein
MLQKVILILSLLILVGCSEKKDGLPTKSDMIENIGELAVYQDNIEFIIYKKIRKDKLAVLTANIKGAWIIKGDATIATNLKNAEIDFNKQTKTVTISLDEPRVIQAGIDHKKTEIDEIIKNIFINQDEESEFRESVMREAQKKIYSVTQKPEKIEKAKERTEYVIKNYYKQLDWNANIEWRD